MSNDQQSPFVPGARVAVQEGWGWREDFVEKADKNGRFRLRGLPDQKWSPEFFREHGWSAFPSPRSVYGHRELRIWDETTDAANREAVGRTNRHDRCQRLSSRLSMLRMNDWITDTLLDAIEAALDNAETARKEAEG